MKEMIKKHWFVLVIGVVLLAFVVVMIADTVKVDVKKKNVDGKSVLFSYNEENYFADEFYDELIENEDIGMIIPIIENELYRNSVEITKAMEKDAEANAENVISQFKAQFGEDYLFFIDDALTKSGYFGEKGEAGLIDFLTIQEAKKQTQINYIKEHKDLYDKYEKEMSPRMISHILIKMEDPENPTEEETEKLNKVKELLAKPDANFAEIAKEYSEDPGSAEKNGSLGIVDKKSVEQFVETFKDNVYTVGVNETTDWIQSEYGYHIIRVDADDLKSFEEEGDEVYAHVLEHNPDIASTVTWQEFNKQDVQVTDPKIFEKVKEYFTAKEAK